MTIDIRALAALHAVMSEGTVTAAAHRLHRTQSVVSRQIAQLEARLRMPLFTRERQRLVPTALGLAFYREAERALAAIGEIDSIAARLRDGGTAPLRVIAPSHVVHGLLPDALALLDQRHPGVHFAIETRQREYISHWIRNRQFDLGISPDADELPGVRSEPLVRAPAYVLMSARHPLASRARLRIPDLAGEPMLLVRPGTPMRRLVDESFAAAGIRPRVRGECASVQATGQLAVRGLGVALVDSFLAADWSDDPGAVLRALSPRTGFHYQVLRPDGDPPSNVQQAFVECLQVAAQSRIERAARGAARRRRPG